MLQWTAGEKRPKQLAECSYVSPYSHDQHMTTTWNGREWIGTRRQLSLWQSNVALVPCVAFASALPLAQAPRTHTLTNSNNQVLRTLRIAQAEPTVSRTYGNDRRAISHVLRHLGLVGQAWRSTW